MALKTLDKSGGSLLPSFKMPEGVLMSAEFQREGDNKWTAANVAGGDAVVLTRLQPGTRYRVRARLGVTGAVSWSGSPEWNAWGPVACFATVARQPPPAPPPPPPPPPPLPQQKQQDGKAQNGRSNGAAQDGSNKGRDFYCPACDVQCNSHHAYDNHLLSQRHAVGSC